MTKLRFNFSAALAVFAILLCVLLLAPSTKAQSFYGSIVGTVTDSSGAAIPGATVTVTNLGTNEARSMQSDASGNYRFVNMVPANYKVQAEKANFKRMVKSPVVVMVDATARVDAALQVGAASETVEVTTQAALLQTESGTLGSQVEGKTVEAMPLNGRNPMNLIALVPGVVPQGSSQGATSINQGDHSNNAGWGNYQIGGSIAGHGVIFIDGAPNNSLGGNMVGFIPTQDAIQEFKVATSAASAEFGRFAGGVVEMTTKSGGNAWHGTAYEYLRNSSLNANSYTYIQNKFPRQKWNQNQYGVAASGPVVKDKIFFMFSWEAFSSRVGQSGTYSVPTPAMMSATNPVIPKVLTDPMTKLTGAANLWKKTGCVINNVDGTSTIPTACLDPAAQILKNYFPDVSKAPFSAYYNASKTLGQGNYTVPYVIGNDNHEYNARGDFNLTEKQRLFARYTHMLMQDIGADAMHSANGYPSANSSSKYFAHQAVVGDTYTINPTTIADFRLSYLRNYGDDVPAGLNNPAGDVASKLGSGWSIVTTNKNASSLTGLTLGGSGPNAGPDQFYTFRAVSGFDSYWWNTYALSASITKIKGSHTFKFGGELRHLDKTTIAVSNAEGLVTTSSTNYTGDEWASFLLGLPSSVAMGTGQTAGDFNWYQGYYGTDTWAATRKLTLSIGIRWELPGGVAEKKNNGTVLLPDYINPANSIRGTLALVNSSLWGDRTTEPALHSLISPRLGFAYRVTNNTVVRGGYSLCAGINRHVVGDARALRERRKRLHPDL